MRSRAYAKMSLAELAKKLGLSKGSVYRLPATLVRRGCAEENANGDPYQLTYRLFAVGNRAAERFGLHEGSQGKEVKQSHARYHDSSAGGTDA